MRASIFTEGHGPPTGPGFHPTRRSGRNGHGAATRGETGSDEPISIPRLIDLYKQGRFPFDKLITYCDFEDINKAVDDTEQGRVIKAVLRP